MYIKTHNYSHYIEWHIQRPERYNGLGPTIGHELLKKLIDLKKLLLSSSTACKSLVITTQVIISKSGRKIWIAGGDLKELANCNTHQVSEYARTYQLIIKLMRALPIPIIILIDGLVIGGASEFILGADIRVATADSCFLYKQTNTGLTCGFGGTVRLQRLIGDSLARYWLLTNKEITAIDALNHGLIHEVIESTADPKKTVERHTSHFARQSFDAIKNMKRSLAILDENDKENLKEELKIFEETWGNKEHCSFLEDFR